MLNLIRQVLRIRHLPDPGNRKRPQRDALYFSFPSPSAYRHK